MNSGSIGLGDVEVKFEKTSSEIVDSVNFRRDLEYVGYDKGVAIVAYKEFKGGIARPAFTQEIRYDLNGGDVVGFRSARFKILSATNASIKYQVIRHLE